MFYLRQSGIHRRYLYRHMFSCFHQIVLHMLQQTVWCWYSFLQKQMGLIFGFGTVWMLGSPKCKLCQLVGMSCFRSLSAGCDENKAKWVPSEATQRNNHESLELLEIVFRKFHEKYNEKTNITGNWNLYLSFQPRWASGIWNRKKQAQFFHLKKVKILCILKYLYLQKNEEGCQTKWILLIHRQSFCLCISVSAPCVFLFSTCFVSMSFFHSPLN